MAEKASGTRECPFCKEEIKATALRCKHCLADIPSTMPEHGGVCPWCKETINPEALRCPHCQADLAPGGGALVLGGRPPLRRAFGRQVAASSARATRGTPLRRVSLADLAAQPGEPDGNPCNCWLSFTEADGSVYDLYGCFGGVCVYVAHATSPYGVFE